MTAEHSRGWTVPAGCRLGRGSACDRLSRLETEDGLQRALSTSEDQDLTGPETLTTSDAHRWGD